MERLPAGVSRVVLFVNAPLREALEVSALPVVDVVQFHGEETPEYLAAFARECRLPVIRAVRLADESQLHALERLGASNVLVDAAVPGAFGGTGARVDWDLARRAVEEFPHLRILLAGGLTPDNVAEAVDRVRPYAVDVASGVEAAVPGRKDARKMADFVAAARRGGA
jgi:phosphoribosylanthranilate isomerase